MRLAILAAAAAIVAPAGAVPVPRDWWGSYAYEWVGGHSAGGSPIVVNYRLVLGPDGCRIAAQGWQTDEVLLCAAEPRGGVLNINFVSYADGAMKNKYGMRRYNPGERLFSLLDKGGTIWTGWGAYAPWENERPLAKHFRKVT